MQEGRKGRNAPRVDGGGKGGGGGWHDDGDWRKDSSSGYSGGGTNGGYREAGKNGGFRDNGSTGGKGYGDAGRFASEAPRDSSKGGWSNGGGDHDSRRPVQNGSSNQGWAPSYNAGMQRSSGPANGYSGGQRSNGDSKGDQKGGGGQRSNPFGAAGPAAPVSDSSAWPSMAEAAERPKAKYVPPAMRDGMGNIVSPSAVHEYEADHGRGGYDNGKNGKGDDRKGKGGGKGGYDSGKGGHDRGKGGHDSGKGGYDSGKGGYDSGKGDDRKGKGGGKGDNGDDRKGKGDKGNKGDGDKGKGKADGGGGSKGGKASMEKGDSKGGKAAVETGKGKSKGSKNGKSEHVSEEPAFKPEPKAKSKSGGSGMVTTKHLSDTRYADLEVSRQTKRAMAEGFGYEFMTEIQAQTIGPLLAGQDVLARARTGTGKTLAFMIPIIESLVEYPAGVGGNISALVLSPTRELAQQIHDESKIILDYHQKLGIVCFFGGTAIKGDHRLLSNQACDILVATPGRMQDHLDNTPNFARRIANLTFLCLDEADQLLETGFRDAILKILGFLPKPADRQGALFSATFPAAVGQIAKLALRPNHATVNTVTDEVTPDQIAQSVAVTDIDNMTETLWGALSSEMARHPKNYKIMVFFVAARVTQLYAEMFNAAGVKCHEIHSRKSQPHRTRAADTFRSEQRGIVFSSDVLARGMDFPAVTAVIQVGLPSARDQYIHRLGRTGRAGMSGGCILLLHDFEAYFLKQLSDLPVKRLNASAPFPGVPAPPDALWNGPHPKTAVQAYQAWLGYYNSAKGLSWKKELLVHEAHRFADSICATGADGLPPPILKKTVGKMGLKGVPGLNLVNVMEYGDDD